MSNAKVPIGEIKTLPDVLRSAGRAAYGDGYPWWTCFAYAAAMVGSTDAVAVITCAQVYLGGWIAGADDDQKISVPKWLRDLSIVEVELL